MARAPGGRRTKAKRIWAFYCSCKTHGSGSGLERERERAIFSGPSFDVAPLAADIVHACGDYQPIEREKAHREPVLFSPGTLHMPLPRLFPDLAGHRPSNPVSKTLGPGAAKAVAAVQSDNTADSCVPRRAASCSSPSQYLRSGIC